VTFYSKYAEALTFANTTQFDEIRELGLGFENTILTLQALILNKKEKNLFFILFLFLLGLGFENTNLSRCRHSF